MIFNYNKIKENKLTYVIAEIGVNHECSLTKAKKMIYWAKKGGASANLKLYLLNIPLHIGIQKKKKLNLNKCYLKNTINLKKKIILL